VNLLEEAGVLEPAPDGRLTTTPDAPSAPQAAELAARVAESRHQVEASRVEMVRGYAETTGCRRQFLLGYFGETLSEPCGNCDACDAGTSESVSGGAWQVNDRVAHDTWGHGVVMRCESDRVTVLFDQVGYKTLKLDAVRAA
jgi:ATP-dependent DNA helicase RecQ